MRTEKRSNGHADPKDSKHISVIPVSRDHDNRNNSIKRSGILFSRTDRGGYRGNINWERRGVIVVVDTTKMDNVCCLNEGFFFFYNPLFAPLVGHGELKRGNERDTKTTNKKTKKNRACWRQTPFMSHYEEDIQSCHMTISTLYWVEGKQAQEENDKLISPQWLYDWCLFFLFLWLQILIISLLIFFFFI